MDFVDKLREIALRVQQHQDLVETEEATKNAFIMPFISALGYDVFNPGEVIPEFTADIGTKKGEKVDYALMKNNDVALLVECKKLSADLNTEHASQLFRYFSTTNARFGLLTNGVDFWFYSDIDEPNKMDAKPFFEFSLLDFSDAQVGELKNFSRDRFSLDDILTTASTLKYQGGIVKVLEKEMSHPSDEFIRFLAGKVYSGALRQTVLEGFVAIVNNALNQFINDQVNSRLKSALQGDDKAPVDSALPEVDPVEIDDSGIVTTQDEIDGFNIVKAILAEVTDVKRVFMRDNKSYCAVLLDDNNRKPLCRLHFNSKQKYIGIMNGKSEDRIPIEQLDAIFSYAAQIKKTFADYQ